MESKSDLYSLVEGTVEEAWEWALSQNVVIPKCERARGARLDICLPARIKRQLEKLSVFVKTESSERQTRARIPIGWKTLCALSGSGYFLYAPRSTFPLFYFSESLSPAFSGLSGLDVGARVPREDDDTFQRVALKRSDNPMLRETFLPYWQHYESLGASMRAIDIIPGRTDPRIEFGDARLLAFPNDSFDFLTVPMLLGPGNPCSTTLEMTACLSEMWRVLKAPGFVHIADATLHPSVCYAAELAGFVVAYSKDHTKGVPVGTFLLKRSDSVGSVLSRFPDLSALPLISLSPTSSEVVFHCNLIDDPLTPVVRRGSLKCSVE